MFMRDSCFCFMVALAVGCLTAGGVSATDPDPTFPQQAALPVMAQPAVVENRGDTTEAMLPAQVVADLHTRLIDVMQRAHSLGWQGRYEHLQPVLTRAYSFADMARIAAGSHWKTFTEEQKASVVEAFSRMSVATYASRFDAYGGERFETVAVEELPPPNPGVMVQTRLVKTDGTDVKLSYRLAETEGGWKIVDVFYRGTISELANQRAQYLTVLSASGYDGLLHKLDEKVKNLATGKAGEGDPLPQ